MANAIIKFMQKTMLYPVSDSKKTEIEDEDVPGVQLAQPVLMGLSCF